MLWKLLLIHPKDFKSKLTNLHLLSASPFFKALFYIYIDSRATDLPLPPFSGASYRHLATIVRWGRECIFVLVSWFLTPFSKPREIQ